MVLPQEGGRPWRVVVGTPGRRRGEAGPAGFDLGEEVVVDCEASCLWLCALLVPCGGKHGDEAGVEWGAVEKATQTNIGKGCMNHESGLGQSKGGRMALLACHGLLALPSSRKHVGGLHAPPLGQERSRARKAENALRVG